MGRTKTSNANLPPRMRLSHGQYFYTPYRNGKQHWLPLGRDLGRAMILYRMSDRDDHYRTNVEPLEVIRLGMDATAFAGEGLYFLWQGAQLVYVGRSLTVSKRVRQHRDAEKILFTAATAIQVGHIESLSLEAAYISAYAPMHNQALPR